MKSALIDSFPIPPKATIKMESVPYLLSLLGHFLILEIFTSYVWSIGLELIEISVLKRKP
jgi:hypothetical protein